MDLIAFACEYINFTDEASFAFELEKCRDSVVFAGLELLYELKDVSVVLVRFDTIHRVRFELALSSLTVRINIRINILVKVDV
jgi:hypothetical protein